jgi:hypothetical protein
VRVGEGVLSPSVLVLANDGSDGRWSSERARGVTIGAFVLSYLTNIDASYRKGGLR